MADGQLAVVADKFQNLIQLAEHFFRLLGADLRLLLFAGPGFSGCPIFRPVLAKGGSFRCLLGLDRANPARQQDGKQKYKNLGAVTRRGRIHRPAPAAVSLPATHSATSLVPKLPPMSVVVFFCCTAASTAASIRAA